MDLPDCPPGTEGYQDSVTEVPKKINDDCTKAEQEFKDHLNSLKIKLENGETRCMVERRGRDVSGMWIYLCYPCAAMCSGESILQTHISGKKHKSKLAMKTVWPLSIFEEHPYVLNEKGAKKTGASDKILQKMAEEVDLHNTKPSDLDAKYNKYKEVECHIQSIIDEVQAPMVGLEYLVEHPPLEPHHEPAYVCVLCTKHGHPRTIVNHMTCFWHRYNYLIRHFPKATHMLMPYRGSAKYREGVSIVMNRLAQRIEKKYGRQRPIHVEKEEFDKDREAITNWIFKSYHPSENLGATFEEVVDIDLITSLQDTKVKEASEVKAGTGVAKKDPSPPVVAAPSKPHFNTFTRSTRRQERRAGSIGSLSDISDEAPPQTPRTQEPPRRQELTKNRYEPYERQVAKYSVRNVTNDKDKQRAPNYAYKLKLASDSKLSTEESLRKSLSYHEKNPEKHPLYPDEWKKFWNRRYKEIQLEGKDPAKHDFKPEWIVFWTKRMKELHDEELQQAVTEIYRKLRLTPPPPSEPEPPAPHRQDDSRKRSLERHRRSPEPRRRSPEYRHRSPDSRRRSPVPRRRSPVYRHRTPESRHRIPEPRRRSPEPRRRSPEPRHRSPLRRRSMDRRPSPNLRRTSPGRRAERSPGRRVTSSMMRSRSRSPIKNPAREAMGARSRSPLSRRLAQRNRSPAAVAEANHPSLQTVLISDDELKPDDGGLSPWNSDGDVDSVVSVDHHHAYQTRRLRSRSRATELSVSSRRTERTERAERAECTQPDDLGPPENVVATLRLLVALEDYLGSIGPKLVDLLTDALRMEKEKANSSEELLERETAVVLIETAKEKLKGAVQAGLVGAGAAPAVRAAVVRCAATLHEADKRLRASKLKNKASSASATVGASGAGGASAAGVRVAGVGEVDRAQIAQQMAAALIAQGKTDVSAEELAQLVDAVVGMAEAKKREAARQKEAERPPPPMVKSSIKMSGTASALQMLQSAYDENDKKIEKDDAPDAMDGLSDSDLETLLKNFNELSAEEQHSLIAYLKKLEAREPQRVERLRQYVSAAATDDQPTAPPPANTNANPNTNATLNANINIEPVNIVSDDDDDYTVEEVFKSVTQKAQEDRIRQEMEIVKKSLEESKPPPKQFEREPEPEPLKAVTSAPAVKLPQISASDLFALVQASIQSTTAATSASVGTTDVVTSSNPPRSFGDLPGPPFDNHNESMMQNRPILTAPAQQNRPFMSAPPQQNRPLMPDPPLQNRPLISEPPLQNRPLMSAPTQQNRPLISDPPQQIRPLMSAPPQQNRPLISAPPQQAPFMNQPNNFQRQPMNQMNYGNRNNVQNEQFNKPNVWDTPPNNFEDRGRQGTGFNRPNFNEFVPDNFNSNNRGGNFNMNSRNINTVQDDYDSRPNDNMHQQQWGNDGGYGRRGGGRGNFGGGMRGRGRGGYNNNY